MSIIQGNAKQGSARGFYNFPIEQSLRFNDDDSAYLSWTPSTPTNQYKWTWSGWVKYSTSTSDKVLFSSYDGSDTSNRALISFDNGVNIGFTNWTGGTRTRLISNAVFRDPSAWYHIVVEFDSTQATDSNRTKIYVNGEQVTSFSSAQYIAQNQSEINKSGEPHQIGSHGTGSYLDGYLAEVNFIDGQALTADSFGELKNGAWIPKDPTGLTYGTNGFRLSFADDAEVEAFNTLLYRGNGGTQSVTGMGFQPDLVWIKDRSGSNTHALYDAVRTATKCLVSADTTAETTRSGLTSFDADGFSLGSLGRENASGQTTVAWGWKAGDSNVSNTDGSITSTVRANTTYGFSIVGWQANNQTVSTVGHGLGVAPDMVIIKNRTSSTNAQWVVGHSAFGFNGQGYLNSTGAFGTNSGSFNNTAPTSTVFTVGTDQTVNLGTNDYIAYCWTEKTGYSKISSYSGTGSSGNSISGLGFAPAFVMIKRSDSGGEWAVYDNTRQTSNPKYQLRANASDAENSNSAVQIDFDSDGFTLNTTDAALNGSSGTYIYAAFADTREAAFWLDQSGNDNDWQPVNLDHNDTVADSPTDNFATWNGVVAGNFTLAEGNLKSTVNTNRNGIVSSMGFDPQDTDGYKAEFTINTLGNMVIGLADETFKTDEGTVFATTQARAVVYGANGTVYDNGSSQGTFSSFTTGDVVTMYVKSGSLYYAVNGTLANSGSAVVTGITEDTVFWLHALSGASSGTLTANFGQQPFVHTTSLDS